MVRWSRRSALRPSTISIAVARQLHRIEMFGNAWVVQELVSIVNEDMNPLPMETFNIDYLLAGCDPEGFFPPSVVNPSRVSDIIVPDPAWGVFTEANTPQAIEDDSNITNNNITQAIEGNFNGLRHSSALIVQQEPNMLEVELKSDSKAFSKMLVIKYYELHSQYMRRKGLREGPKASVEGMDDSGCTNGCCFFSTASLGEDIETAFEKKLGITGGIKFCFQDGIDPGICIIHSHCIQHDIGIKVVLSLWRVLSRSFVLSLCRYECVWYELPCVRRFNLQWDFHVQMVRQTL